jgi:hypothetical protein
MESSSEALPQPATQRWTYASLTVLDGTRPLKPSHVGPDRLQFTEPPRLTSETVEVILRNGDEEQRHTAIVLPHDAAAMRIPINLLPPHNPVE